MFLTNVLVGVAANIIAAIANKELDKRTRDEIGFDLDEDPDSATASFKGIPLPTTNPRISKAFPNTTRVLNDLNDILDSINSKKIDSETIKEIKKLDYIYDTYLPISSKENVNMVIKLLKQIEGAESEKYNTTPEIDIDIIFKKIIYKNYSSTTPKVKSNFRALQNILDIINECIKDSESCTLDELNQTNIRALMDNKLSTIPKTGETISEYYCNKAYNLYLEYIESCILGMTFIDYMSMCRDEPLEEEEFRVCDKCGEIKKRNESSYSNLFYNK